MGSYLPDHRHFSCAEKKMIHSPKQTLTTNISPGKGKDSHVYPLYMIACRQANIFHVFYKLSQMLWVHECKKKYYQRQCLTELLPWSRTNILSAFTSVSVLWDLVGMISLSHWNQRSAILIFCISVSHKYLYAYCTWHKTSFSGQGWQQP